MPTSDTRAIARAITHARSRTNSEEALSVLRSLCRSGALAIELEPDGGIGIVASTGRLGRSGRSDYVPAKIAADIWKEILQLGWAVPHETLEGWRISNAGRIALKRKLSRSGAPAPATAAAAGDRSTPAGGASMARVPRGASNSTPQQNDSESPLAWLRQRRDRQGRSYISEAQFAAGERLRRDFTYGSMMPSVTSRWSPVSGGTSPGSAPDRELELRDSQLRARDRFRAALSDVGPEFANVLVDVCCYLMGLEEVEAKSGWPRRTAMVVLLLALSALARHYGIEDRNGGRCRDALCGQQPLHA